MTCAAVIYEGLKRTWDLDRINAEMKPFQGQYVWAAADPLYRFQDAGLDEEENALLEASDGRKTVKTLSALSILPPIDTARLLLLQVVTFNPRLDQWPGGMWRAYLQVSGW